MPMSALTMPQWSTIERVGDDGVGDVLRQRAGSGPCRRGSPCRRRTSPPRRRWCGRVSTSIDELGVGEAHAVADRRAEHLGIGAAVELHRAVGDAFFAGFFASSGPSPCRGSRTPCDRPRARPARPCAAGRARSAPRCPPAMFSRKPRAAARSKRSARVGLGEVVVRADLDRPVAGVGDRRACTRARGPG